MAARYAGKDEQGNAIYNEWAEIPVLTFEGTVKVHGTNAGIGYDVKEKTIAPIKRSGPMNSWTGHMGFNDWLFKNKIFFEHFFDKINSMYSMPNTPDEIVIYGEWAGNGIQKGVAVSSVEKFFMPFSICLIKNLSEGYERHWLSSNQLRDLLPHNPEIRCFSVYSFPIFKINIDFNNPENSLDELEKMTLEVEQACPVGKSMGVKGFGEGIVFTTVWRDETIRFKSKGEKHSDTKSKSKKINNLNPEKINTINEFVEFAVTKHRVEKAAVTVNESTDFNITKTGEVVKWIFQDIIKENMEELTSNDLTGNDVYKAIGKQAVKFYKELVYGF